MMQYLPSDCLLAVLRQIGAVWTFAADVSTSSRFVKILMKKQSVNITELHPQGLKLQLFEWCCCLSGKSDLLAAFHRRFRQT